MKETKSKKNKVKRLVGVICILLMFIIGEVHPTYVFAQVNESEIESEETQETALEKDNGEREVRFPNKLEAKEPPSDNQVGSQSDSINKGIPTAEGSAKAEIIENVNKCIYFNWKYFSTKYKKEPFLYLFSFKLSFLSKTMSPDNFFPILFISIKTSS